MATQQITVTIVSATGHTHIVDFMQGSRFTDLSRLDAAVRVILAGSKPTTEEKIDLAIDTGDGQQLHTTMQVRAYDFKSTIAYYAHSENYYANMAPVGIYTAERIERMCAFYAEIFRLLTKMDVA